MVSTERSDIAGNSTSQLILNLLAHLRVGLVGPIAAVVVSDFLHNCGNAGLLGNGHESVADNSEDRRSTSILLHFLIGAQGALISHKEIIALQGISVAILGLKDIVGGKGRTRLVYVLHDRLCQPVEQIVVFNGGRLAGAIYMIGQILSSSLC